MSAIAKMVKRYYDAKHPAYTDEAVKIFVVAKMITADEYKQITGKDYAPAEAATSEVETSTSEA